MRVAVLNAGSGTIKTALVDVKAATAQVHTRHVFDLVSGSDEKSVLSAALDALDGDGDGDGEVDAVGHRVVHGGRELTQPVLIDAAVEDTIDRLARLAPLHNPLALRGIRAARERFPGRPMVALFDTSFHARRSAESLRYPLPQALCESLDLFRYGFHGIAHTSLVESLAAKQKVAVSEVTALTLQLGAGCSACAVLRGQSIETSMGFSPLGGLPMATRVGDLDPAVVLELIRHGYTVAEVEELLTHGSGLQALAGVSDMREILEAESQGDDRAALAVALFVREIVACVGAYFTLLGGAGSLVFGGGIGTHSAEIRKRVAEGLSAWSIELDPLRNAQASSGRISRHGTRSVYLFQTDEERIIARSVYSLLTRGEN